MISAARHATYANCSKAAVGARRRHHRRSAAQRRRVRCPRRPNLTGLFIERGPVVQVKDSSGKIEVERDPDPEQVYAGPLAVLVDRNSASASRYSPVRSRTTAAA